MEITICLVLIFVFILLGMPVFYSFLTGTLAYTLIKGLPAGFIPRAAFYTLDSYVLLAIPLFLIAGAVMETGGLADLLVDFANALVSKFKGGMGATITVASMFFGTICGSGLATVAAIGSIMIPKLDRFGWDRRYTCALVCASGPLGYMIPPNVNAIIYGVLADASVGALFLATVIPGIIWGVSLIIVNRFMCKNWMNSNTIQQGLNNPNSSYWRNLGNSSLPAIPAFIMALIILGGIYSGAFTPTEAGGVAAVYALIIGVISRKITFKKGYNTFMQSGRSFAAFFIIFPTVMVFTRILIIEQVPQAIAVWLTGISSDKYVILTILNIVFLIAGMFFESGVLLFVFTPLLIPTALQLGVDRIHLGVLIFMAIGIGTMTPPMAVGLFLAARVGGIPVKDVIKPLIPLIVLGCLPALILTTYFPELSLWLPRVVLGH